MIEKRPLYTPTKSLDVKYNFIQDNKENASVIVHSKDTHAILNTGCVEFFKLRSTKYKSSVDNINFATASVTLLYTDTSTEEGYLGDDIQQQVFALNVPDKKDRILSSIDFYRGRVEEPPKVLILN